MKGKKLYRREAMLYWRSFVFLGGRAGANFNVDIACV